MRGEPGTLAGALFDVCPKVRVEPPCGVGLARSIVPAERGRRRAAGLALFGVDGLGLDKVDRAILDV